MDNNGLNKSINNNSKIKKILLNFKISLIITLILINGAVFAGYKYFNEKNEKENNVKTEEKNQTEVNILKIEKDSNNKNFISFVGIIKPELKLDVISLSKGTVKNLFFEIGDEISLNKPLASVYNDAISIGYNNSQTNYSNLQDSMNATINTTNKNIYQTEIGIANAIESIKSAEINLSSAEDNLKNSLILQEKKITDAREGAITSFNSYLNTINYTLEQINYIIGAEAGIRIEGINDTLSVKNPQSLNDAKEKYLQTKNKYKINEKIELNQKNIYDNLKKIISNLSLAKETVDKTIEVLNNSIANVNFSEASLSAQLSAFSSHRTNIINSLTSAENLSRSIENILLANDQEKNALGNAIDSAESRLEIAKIGYDNAVAYFESSIEIQEQQITASQISLDNSKGQLDSYSSQIGDLLVKAPVAGVITGKYIEIGTEVNPGQKIAEISKIKTLKIEVNLLPENVYKIKKDQSVKIEEKFEGKILSIDPIVNSTTKKVRVEIIFDNKNNDLIPGSFVDVVITLEKIEKTSENSIFIPLKTIITTQTEIFVFINEENKAKKINVKTGKTVGSLIEILEGLNDGDELIIEGGKNLEDGEKIKINN